MGWYGNLDPLPGPVITDPIRLLVVAVAQMAVATLFGLLTRGQLDSPTGAVFLGLLISQLALVGLLIGASAMGLAASAIAIVAGYGYGMLQLNYHVRGIVWPVSTPLCGAPIALNMLLSRLYWQRWRPLLGVDALPEELSRQIRLRDLFGIVTIAACLLVLLRALGRSVESNPVAAPTLMAVLFTMTSWLPLVVTYFPGNLTVRLLLGLFTAIAIGSSFSLLVATTNRGFWIASMVVEYICLLVSLQILQGIAVPDDRAPMNDSDSRSGRGT